MTIYQVHITAKIKRQFTIEATNIDEAEEMGLDKFHAVVPLNEYDLENNNPMEIETISPPLSGKRTRVTRDTRAGKNGRVITCPECNKASTVSHFAWAALLCRHCRAVVDKGNWITDVTFRGKRNGYR